MGLWQAGGWRRLRRPERLGGPRLDKGAVGGGERPRQRHATRGASRGAEGDVLHVRRGGGRRAGRRRAAGEGLHSQRPRGALLHPLLRAGQGVQLHRPAGGGEGKDAGVRARGRLVAKRHSTEGPAHYGVLRQAWPRLRGELHSVLQTFCGDATRRKRDVGGAGLPLPLRGGGRCAGQRDARCGRARGRRSGRPGPRQAELHGVLLGEGGLPPGRGGGVDPQGVCLQASRARPLAPWQRD